MKWVRLAAFSFSLLTVQFAAAQNQLDGMWKAGLVLKGHRCIFSLTNTAGQHYSETLRCGAAMTGQSGTYVFNNGTLARTVTDWEPKRRYVLDNGYSGHYEPNARPAGGTFKVTFTSPDNMVWRDVNLGGTITYRRVH